MTKPVVTLLTGPENFAVIHLRERRFPGVVVQGDSLNILVTRALHVARRARTTRDADLVDEADRLARSLVEIRRRYEGVMKRNKLELPYSKGVARRGR